MDDALCAVVLAAGSGTRLRPLTNTIPKPLCTIGSSTLLDLNLARAQRLCADVAVNVCHLGHLIESHLGDRPITISREQPQALGTAGALAQLLPWIAGRDVLVVNSDSWSPDPLEELVRDWDRVTTRLLVTYDPARADFDRLWRFAGASLLPNRSIAHLTLVPSGLYEYVWRHELDQHRVQLVPSTYGFIDCGTPQDLLAANLVVSRGQNVISPSAQVRGTVTHSLVLDGAIVNSNAIFDYAIVSADHEPIFPFPVRE